MLLPKKELGLSQKSVVYFADAQKCISIVDHI